MLEIVVLKINPVVLVKIIAKFSSVVVEVLRKILINRGKYLVRRIHDYSDIIDNILISIISIMISTYITKYRFLYSTIFI